MKGRKPIATETRIQRGETPRTPVVVGGRQAPPMPRGLDRVAQTAWRQLVADLTKSGAIDRADAIGLEIIATAVGRYRKARAVVNAKGFLHENSQGTVTHPAVGVMERAEQRLTQLIDRFPLSPWGRARLGLLLSGSGDEGAEAELEETLGPTPKRLRVVGLDDD